VKPWTNNQKCPFLLFSQGLGVNVSFGDCTL
jgi:hypothetical protein